jgi:hypothetical protein
MISRLSNTVAVGITLILVLLPRGANAQEKELSQLRSQLKYPYFLEFAVKELQEQTEGERWGTDLGIEIAPNRDPSVIESFYCYHRLFALQRIRSFDRRTRYLLLHEVDAGGTALFLFNDSESNPRLLSEYGLRNGDFALDTLNGGDIIRATMFTTGSDFVGNHLVHLAVVNDAFLEQFHCYLTDQSFWQDSLTNTTSQPQFIDLNGDGFLDISVSESRELLDSKTLSRVAHLSDRVRTFIWDSKRYLFREIN